MQTKITYMQTSLRRKPNPFLCRGVRHRGSSTSGKRSETHRVLLRNPGQTRSSRKSSAGQNAGLMGRITVGDTFAIGTCGLKCVAFQRNYYENYKNPGYSRIPGARRLRASVLCTAKSFQLAPCQRRERAVGPRELSYRAHLPSGT